MMRICAIVPHYDHVEQFERFLPRLLSLNLPLIVVDDGSPDETFARLCRMLEAVAPDATVLHHSSNQGKGGAVITGLRKATESGYSHALQIDADGQHSTDDIERFVAATRSHPDRLICGKPEFDDSISTLRYCSRHITLYLCWLSTLSREIEDALCGLRIYPLQSVMPIVDGHRLGRRMDFDPEILVRCVWSGVRLHYLPVVVRYPDDGRSHYHYFSDNLVVAWMHVRLAAGMVPRLPELMARQWRQASRDTGT
jgi:glycosyltransferase involved in cell wall biosynthesis